MNDDSMSRGDISKSDEDIATDNEKSKTDGDESGQEHPRIRLSLFKTENGTQMFPMA